MNPPLSARLFFNVVACGFRIARSIDPTLPKVRLVIGPDGDNWSAEFRCSR